MLRWLFIPLWIALFFLCIYLYGIYKELVLFQLSRLLGCFLILWDKTMLLMRLKTVDHDTKGMPG